MNIIDIYNLKKFNNRLYNNINILTRFKAALY